MIKSNKIKVRELVREMDEKTELLFLEEIINKRANRLGYKLENKEKATANRLRDTPIQHT